MTDKHNDGHASADQAETRGRDRSIEERVVA